ncbi:PREDICTED: charged multivesicular body protein 7-like [Amphimedon queenslandica]|uniref:Uncharacterized protein n=1 Tax=Amphimedon queenslandica TaxID=400682 RepID=A0AAN0IU68_AMPQE|nr:PREDICTED: charged multivesicular body protein 7-like [Amphimedon queenslandica]|eukprot:XP_011409200.1 PREDICTED: charged multivesicular body protein 7-like [Amphimedon queenslandica]
MACEFNVPEEWKDEARMHFLVSDFSPSHEPTLSDDRVKFWRALIRSSSQELHKWTFTKRELSQRLAWHQFEPKCLPRLLDVLERAGEIRKLDSYRFDEMGWTEWSLRLMSTPVTWAWKMAWQKSPDQSSQDVVYVLVPAVKFKDLLRNVTSAGVSDRCLHALELQLLEGQKIKRGHMSADTDEVIVKFATSPSGKATPVSEIDIGILSIMRTITGMQKKIDNGNEEIQKLKGPCSHEKNDSYFKKSQFGGLEIDEDDLLRELEELDDVEKVTEKMRSFKIEECKPVTPQKVVHNQADEEKKPKEKLPKAKPMLLT